MPAFAVSTCFLAIDSDRTASSRTKCFLSSVHCGPSSLSQSLHVALIDPTCFLGLLRDVAGTFSILFDLATIWTILLRALHLFDPIDASHRQFQDFLADQVDTTRNLSRFTFAQLFKKSARAGSALPSDDTVLLTNTACVGCKKCPVHCLKDGRWRPKPGSKFDNVKSPPPLLVTTPLAAPKLFSLSLTTRTKRNSPAKSPTRYSKQLNTSNPSLMLALLTTTLALPTPTPSVTMRRLIPNFLS